MARAIRGDRALMIKFFFLQSRTRPSSLAPPAYHDGKIPGQADGGGQDGAVIVYTPFRAAVSLVGLPPSPFYCPPSLPPIPFPVPANNPPPSSGECATHFLTLLAKFPPQVGTRSAAAAWACHVHNEVNKSLGKKLFDCSKIGDFYDCGCAEEDEGEGRGGGNGGEKKVEMIKDGEGPGRIDLRVMREG